MLRKALYTWCSIVSLFVSSAAATSGRPMTVDDLLGVEQLGAIRASPDGEWLAVVVKRGRTAGEVYRGDYLQGNGRADIWIVPRRGGTPQRIANGEVDGSGYWNPTWSPDSKRIALLSTKGGDNVYLYVWDRTTEVLTRLSTSGVRVNLSALGFGPYNPVIWLSDTSLICPVLPESQKSVFFNIGSQTQQLAPRDWLRFEKGLESTASVLETGVAERQSNQQGQLLLIETDHGSRTVISDGNFSQLIPSPNGRYIAVIAEAGFVAPKPKYLLDVALGTGVHSRLGILSVSPKPTMHWIEGLFDPLRSYPPNPQESVTFGWSPDSSYISVIAKADPNEDRAETVVVVQADNALVLNTVRSISATNVAWSSGNDLLAYGRLRNQVPHRGKTPRSDWWVLAPSEPRQESRSLPRDLKDMPVALFATTEKHTLLGVVAGRLCSVDVVSGTVQYLTDSSFPRIESIAWPTGLVLRGQQVSEVVIQTSTNEGRRFYRLRVSGSRLEAGILPSPPGQPSLIDYGADQSAVFTSDESSGSYVWTALDGSGRIEKIFRINEQLAEVAEAQRVLIKYRGGNGQELNALVLLPLSYQKGQRYPLVVWADSGHIIKDTNYFLAAKADITIPHNLQLLASHGYAVLVPSIPLARQDQASDQYRDIPKGVLPAVDKVIEMGIADPKRLAVMGQSHAGYATYTIITQTDRFKAAVAVAGPADLVSLYGTFDSRLRYTSRPQEDLFSFVVSELGPLRMGNTLWGDSGRYVRNSPIFYLDRVNTPLMIVQGDLDYVPIEQGEEFFTGMHRLGKRAEFVRYWGEGHTIQSPANIRDMWQRIYAWFDEFLMETDDKKPSKE